MNHELRHGPDERQSENGRLSLGTVAHTPPGHPIAAVAGTVDPTADPPFGERPETTSRHVRTLVALYVAAMFVQDFGPTQKLFRRPGGNLAMFVLPFILFQYRREVKHIRRTDLGRFITVAMAFVVFTAFMSCLTLMWLPQTARGELLVVKATKETVITVSWIASFAGGMLCVLLAPNVVRRALWVSIGLMAIVLAIELHSPTGSLSQVGVFHGVKNIQQRPRLLTTESSSAGALMGTSVLLLALLERSRRTRVVLLACGSIFIALLLSKGALAAWALCLVLGLVAYLLSGRWRRGFLSPIFVALALSAGSYMAYGVAGSISARLNKSEKQAETSSASRDVYLRSGLVALNDRPLGAGFGGDTVYTDKWLKESRAAITGRYQSRSFREIDRLLASGTDLAFAPKTLPVQLIYYGGYVGLALFLCLAFRISIAVRRMVRFGLSCFWVTSAALFCLIGVVTYATSIYEYSTTMLLGAILGGALVLDA